MGAPAPASVQACHASILCEAWRGYRPLSQVFAKHESYAPAMRQVFAKHEKTAFARVKSLRRVIMRV